MDESSRAGLVFGKGFLKQFIQIAENQARVLDKSSHHQGVVQELEYRNGWVKGGEISGWFRWVGCYLFSKIGSQLGIFLVQAVERLDEVVARVYLQVEINHVEQALSLVPLDEIGFDKMSNGAHVRGGDHTWMRLELGRDLKIWII